MKKSRVVLIVMIVVLLLLIAGFGGLVGFITDYLWFRELGYTSVFFKQLFTQLKIGVPTFLVLTALAYLYLMALKKGYFKRITTAEPSVSSKTLNGISLGFAAVAGTAITFMAVTRLWFEALKFANSTEFGIRDPIFNHEVSFYVFKLQFITELNQILISVIIAFAALTFIYYFLLMSLCRPRIFEAKGPAPETDEERFSGEFQQNSGGGFGGFSQAFEKFGEAFNKQMGGGNAGGGAFRPQKPKQQFSDTNLRELLNIASNQIVVMGVIFFLMLGVNFFLKQYDLLYSSTGVLYGAGFTDINVTLWMYRALIVLSVLAALFFALGVKRRRYKTVLTVPVIMIIVGAVGIGAATVVQSLVVSPDELNKESRYLAHNIAFTQNAYDLQSVRTQAFAADNTLTKEDIQNNSETFANIRINDYEPAKTFYNQSQGIRQYYTFNDVDVDRYMVNGEYTQTFLSAREIDEEKINQEWLTRHLMYTHGYGITMSRVDQVTSNGQPDLMVKNIPPQSDIEEIEITRPEIYFGELTRNYLVVNTDVEEYDYPQGDENVYNFYEGEAGIKLNLLNRSLFAIREQSLKLLVSTNITGESRIIVNRNIMDRVQTIMPYLEYDTDPYIVTADGRLYWMLDAYTTSSYYPYSEPFNAERSDVNYIRNSVKVVIDAYNGDVSYYLVNDQDPVANTFMNIYPQLFKPFSEMPESLQSHIRYPNDLLNIQANVYKRYHVHDVRVFYQGEDMWDISQELLQNATEPVAMTPQYYIMKLPGETDVEFINSIPFTPRNRRNMTALMVARNDGDHYGELILYQLPKSRIVYGPMQVEAFIDQNDTIAKEFSLWSNSGSTYTRGNMFVIPVEQSLIYVEPIYLEAANSSLPEVRRVIVSYNNRIAYESTLAAALDSLFGTGSSDQLPDGGATGEGGEGDSGVQTVDELILSANEAYNAAIQAQQAGDWATYGRELKRLEDYLNQLLPAESVGDPDAAAISGDPEPAGAPGAAE